MTSRLIAASFLALAVSAGAASAQNNWIEIKGMTHIPELGANADTVDDWAVYSPNGRKIGEVAGLWRYPVRSLRGEALRCLPVGLDGVVGDRAYGIADPEIGELVSSSQGKRRWRGLVG